MARIVYNLKKFDADKAMGGALCVMVSSSVSGSVASLNTDGSRNPDFMGAGISKYTGLDTFTMMVQGTKYKFNNVGIGLHPNGSYKLMLGSIDSNITLSGNSSISNNTTLVTRSSDGSITTSVNYGKSSDIVIDSLNARDEFAVQVLKELLGGLENPAAVSSSEMSYYCDTAYQWAAYMMEASANARGSFTQQSSSSSGTITTRADVAEDSLSSNTEKLLNNMVSGIEKLQQDFASLLDFYNNYYRNGVNVTNMDSLVSAVNSLASSVGSRVAAVNNEISAINSDISDVEGKISSLDSRVSALESASSEPKDTTTTN